MTSEQFRAWKKLMGFTNETAGHALGLSKHTVRNYACKDTSRLGRNGIPLHVELACAAVKLGITDYPEEGS